MFKNIINNTAFTSEKAEMFFRDRITTTSSGFNDDKSFISSLRAFLWDKIPVDEELVLKLQTKRISDCLESISEIATNGPIFSVINLYDISTISEDKKVDIKTVADKCQLQYNAKVEALFIKEFDVMCFTCPEKKSVIFFVPNLTVQKWHLLQCAILGVVPWYFNPKKDTLSEDDKDLMNSLKRGQDDDYLRCINKIAQKIDFKTEYIKSALNGFEHKYEKEQYDITQSEIVSIESRITDLQSKISEYIRMIEEKNLLLFSLSHKFSQDEGDSEIMRYFINNQALDLVRVDGSKLRFICKGYLTYFDSNEAEKYIDNKNSRFYIFDSYAGRGYRNAPSFEDAHMLFKAIFIDRILKVRMCAAYEINTGNARAVGLSNYPYGGEYDCYMANPHIDYHSCIGTYSEIFTDCLKRHDYIGCIESTIASALSLNLSDFTVLGEFISLLWSPKSTDRSTTNSTRCIELPNGMCLHAKDAIAWLKEEAELKNKAEGKESENE